MTNQDIKEALALLNEMANAIEETYIANEGEVTEEIQIMEEQYDALASLISSEGADSLGRWLKAKEDEKAALKAEKDYITRQMAGIDKTIEYIKSRVAFILKVTGKDKIKGQNGYAFSQYTSVKTTVDKATLESRYKARLNEALFAAGLPDYIGATLTASVSVWKECSNRPEADAAIFLTDSQDTCKFTKPKANREA